MIRREDAERLREELLGLLVEDAHNAARLEARLDALTRERGVDAHAALLMTLCRQAFPEDEARRHWEAITRHRAELSGALDRDVGLRVALLDYFVHVNRQLVQPTLIDVEMLEVVERSSGVDPVTGLANERAFRSEVQAEMRRARRYRGELAVALFDLDEFRRVEQAAGIRVGDRVLRELGILLKNCSRDVDTAARPGSDEFALVLPETGRNGALLVAERFRLEVVAYFRRREIAGVHLPVAVSGGVASYPGDADRPEGLLAAAAQALYRAKAEGKNACQVWSPERRRFLRFDLEPGRFEVEVLSPAGAGGDVVNVSRNGIVFGSPEPLHVGERIELRLQDPAHDSGRPALRARGTVVRLEAMPEPGPGDDDEEASAEASRDRFEVGVALEDDLFDGGDTLLDFLERAHADLDSRDPS